MKVNTAANGSFGRVREHKIKIHFSCTIITISLIKIAVIVHHKAIAFTQTRVGRNLREFKLTSFRSVGIGNVLSGKFYEVIILSTVVHV